MKKLSLQAINVNLNFGYNKLTSLKPVQRVVPKCFCRKYSYIDFSNVSIRYIYIVAVAFADPIEPAR